MGYEWLATFNAILNGIAAVLLVVGWVLIARGNWKAHRWRVEAIIHKAFSNIFFANSGFFFYGSDINNEFMSREPAGATI